MPASWQFRWHWVVAPRELPGFPCSRDSWCVVLDAAAAKSTALKSMLVSTRRGTSTGAKCCRSLTLAIASGTPSIYIARRTSQDLERIETPNQDFAAERQLLSDASRTSSGSPRTKLRSWLVVSQTALAVVLIGSAGLMLLTFINPLSTAPAIRHEASSTA